MPGMCVACRHEAQVYPQGQAETYRLHITCESCGLYEANTNAWDYLKYLSEREAEWKLLPYLSAHIRQATDAGEIVLLTLENWRVFADGHRSTPVPTKLQKLLEYIARDTNIGAWLYLANATIERRLAAVADVRDLDELGFVLGHLRDAGLIELDHALPPPPERRQSDGSYEKPEKAIRLTVGGWAAATPVAPGGLAGTCFVAMAFDRTLDDVLERGIKPAVEACGVQVRRVDKIEHNGVVTDLILAEIRRAQFVVADVTLQRQGVYFEAGFALGLGRTVIWSCRKDEMDAKKVHFDTRQYSHVVWTDAANLRTKLEARIRATVPIQVKS